eukprot:3461837-Amphidinium_carterae.1
MKRCFESCALTFVRESNLWDVNPQYDFPNPGCQNQFDSSRHWRPTFGATLCASLLGLDESEVCADCWSLERACTSSIPHSFQTSSCNQASSRLGIQVIYNSNYGAADLFIWDTLWP